MYNNTFYNLINKIFEAKEGGGRGDDDDFIS